MDGAVYAIIVNVCVALLFATTFAVVRLSYPQQRAASWFSAAYFLGMLTPLSELGIRFTNATQLFVATSYVSFLASLIALGLGVSALSGAPARRLTAITVLAAGLVCRALIWNGPRNELWYEVVYQAPFFIACLVSTSIAIAVTRKTWSAMWLALSVVFTFMAIYFIAKPFFAASFGSGISAKAYAASPYALFSQALGGILIVMAGLLILLMIVQSVLNSSIDEAETDALTCIANRRGFDRKAARLLEVARQTNQPLAVILFDLDHFKRVNDGYGHATGDAVLKAFATTLVNITPASALTARLGGEEFVVLLDRTTMRGAWLAAQAIRAALPYLGAHLPAVTVSGGIAELKVHDSLETMLARADERAYLAKTSGRNRIYPMPEPLTGEAGLALLQSTDEGAQSPIAQRVTARN